MSRLNSWLLVAGLLGLCGCASLLPDNSVWLAAREYYRLQPAAALGQELTATQKISATFDGRTEIFLATLQIDKSGIVMVATSASGLPLFELAERDGELDYRALAGLPAGLKPRYLLADLQLVMWPREAIRDGLADSQLQLDESGAGGYQRSLSLAGEKIITIEYGALPAWTGPVNYRNRLREYQLRVETLEWSQ